MTEKQFNVFKIVVSTATILMGLFLFGVFIVASLKLTGNL